MFIILRKCFCFGSRSNKILGCFAVGFGSFLGLVGVGGVVGVVVVCVLCACVCVGCFLCAAHLPEWSKMPFRC